MRPPVGRRTEPHPVGRAPSVRGRDVDVDQTPVAGGRWGDVAGEHRSAGPGAGWVQAIELVEVSVAAGPAVDGQDVERAETGDGRGGCVLAAVPERGEDIGCGRRVLHQL